MLNSSRKPFSDLTNRLSSVSVSSIEDTKTAGKVKVGSSSSNKLPAVSIYSDDSKPRKIKESSSTSVDEELKNKRKATVEPMVSKDSPEKQLEEIRPNRVTRPANLNLSPILGASSLETLTEFSEAASQSSAVPLPPQFHQAVLPGSFFYLGAPSNDGFQLMSPYPFPPPALPQFHGSQGQDSVAYVVEEGYISLKMSHGIVLDIGNDLTLRLSNPRQQTKVAVTSGSQQAAIIHPQGRALVYEPRIEVQVEDQVSVKNAKFYPRGISFTANNLALVYLLDEAGARSTSDSFHDLHASDIVDTLFREQGFGQQNSMAVSCQQLDNTKYWRTQRNVDCWAIDDVFIQQTVDGFVMVDRRERDGSKVILRVSPTNGKMKLFTSSAQVTASRGQEAHFFLKSGTRRLHYSGTSNVFTVRMDGHSAGFEEEGSLKIY